MATLVLQNLVWLNSVIFLSITLFISIALLYSMDKSKKPANIKHIANWYFGTFCSRCSRIDRVEDKYAKDCYDKIHLIADKLIESGRESMTYKEFGILIKDGSTFCKPIKREFHECQICKALGIRQRW